MKKIAKKYFGTDGIRGIYGEDLNERLAELVGNCAGKAAGKSALVVCRDNRPGGESLSSALIAGALRAGADVVDLGVAATPCAAFAVMAISAAAGIVISASHNPARYNGIKIFGGDGTKLNSEAERGIEAFIERDSLFSAALSGKLLGAGSLRADYLSSIAAVGGDLTGLDVVLDCANGATSEYAPALFERMGARVTPLGCAGDGRRINEGCGALFPSVAADATLSVGADVGFSFDGDADRVIAANERGETADGDDILYVLACELQAEKKLRGSAAVGTLHTNMGTQNSLEKHGVSLYRTDIGDHFVVSEMRRRSLCLGGEQSGHIIWSDHSSTGDGLLAAAALAAIVKRRHLPLSVINDGVKYPQINVDVLTDKKAAIAADIGLAEFVEKQRAALGENGRILLRPSGTEPKIRIMTESPSAERALKAAAAIEECIKTNF